MYMYIYICEMFILAIYLQNNSFTHIIIYAKYVYFSNYIKFYQNLEIIYMCVFYVCLCIQNYKNASGNMLCYILILFKICILDD